VTAKDVDARSLARDKRAAQERVSVKSKQLSDLLTQQVRHVVALLSATHGQLCLLAEADPGSCCHCQVAMRKLMERNTLLPGSPPAASASAPASAASASASEPDPAAEVDDSSQLQPLSPQSPPQQPQQQQEQPQQPQQRLQQPFILVATQPQAVVHVNESPDRRTVEFSFRWVGQHAQASWCRVH
jgi:hypothetical protein